MQVDFDPMALGRFYPVDVPVLAEVGVAARALAATMPADRRCHDLRGEVAERWAIWRDEKARRRADDRGEGVGAASVFDALSRLVPADAIVPVDVGNHAYSFGRYFETRGQTVLMSGYLGSIGFSLPAAMGCWAATQSRREHAGRAVVSVSGDGGFGQYAMELTTAAKYGMDITHVLLNNNELGKISKEQRAAELDVWQTSLHNPDFAAFADLCGARGLPSHLCRPARRRRRSSPRTPGPRPSRDPHRPPSCVMPPTGVPCRAMHPGDGRCRRGKIRDVPHWARRRLGSR